MVIGGVTRVRVGAKGSAFVVALGRLRILVGGIIMPEFRDGILIYGEGELDQGVCAPNPRWAASQLAAYGVEVVMRSGKLKSILLCSKVLELAEVPFRVEPGTAGDPPTAEDLVVATEVQAEDLVEVQAEVEEPSS